MSWLVWGSFFCGILFAAAFGFGVSVLVAASLADQPSCPVAQWTQWLWPVILVLVLGATWMTGRTHRMVKDQVRYQGGKL